MTSSSGWPFRSGGFGFGGSGPPRQKRVPRCEPSGAADPPPYDPKQAYASAYLQAGLGHAGVAFVGDVIAQRVEGRWGTKIRDPLPQEREILKLVVGGELAQRWAAWRAGGVAERRRRRREEKERRALELEGGEDDEGGPAVKPPLADVRKRGLENGGASTSSHGGVEDGVLVATEGVGEQGMEGGVRKSEGVLSFVHTAFKGFLSLSPLGGKQAMGGSSGAGRGPQNGARPASPTQAPRRGPCHDPDAPPGYSLLRSLRMASFAFFVDHPLTNFWTQSISYNPHNDPGEMTAVKLALTEAVLAPARVALLFVWDSMLQRKPKRVVRKLRSDFRPAVVRNLQVAAFENVAFYALSKEVGLPEEVIYAVVGLPVSLYINYFQSTVTAR